MNDLAGDPGKETLRRPVPFCLARYPKGYRVSRGKRGVSDVDLERR
jgi:hypothetical protein